MTQTLPAPPPGAGDPVAAVVCVVAGVAAGAIAGFAGAGVGGVAAGIAAGAGFATGVADVVDALVVDAAVVDAEVVDAAPYHVFTPLCPWHAPFLLAPEYQVPSLQRPVAPAGGVPVAAVEVVEAACVFLLDDDDVAAGVDEVDLAVDLVVDVQLVDASAGPYHSFTP